MSSAVLKKLEQTKLDYKAEGVVRDIFAGVRYWIANGINAVLELVGSTIVIEQVLQGPDNVIQIFTKTFSGRANGLLSEADDSIRDYSMPVM